MPLSAHNGTFLILGLQNHLFLCYNIRNTVEESAIKMLRNKKLLIVLAIVLLIVFAIVLAVCIYSFCVRDKDPADNPDPVPDPTPQGIVLTISKTFIEVNDSAALSYTLKGEAEVKYVFVSGSECVTRNGQTLTAVSKGRVVVKVSIDGEDSNTVELQIVDPADDPYQNVASDLFYGSNYNEATSLEDSYWRTKHNLMSGSIADQDQAPTTASNQPKSGNKFVRNSDANFVDNGNTFEVVDGRGNVVNRVYKFGAYVTLEDVAAYVYAFGDVPANYNSNTSTKPSNSPWGKYLRLNHSVYSNNTTKYPYEPKLPEDGPSGKMKYYEIDIGTTGTDSGGYKPMVYNNGTSITRGAARIVYTRYYANGNHIDDLKDRYVFYTYNHYNDFQEYLNYQGGWGTKFGNISNGGIYNKGNNPSPYVEVVRQQFTQIFK